jgi:hypothetical protein
MMKNKILRMGGIILLLFAFLYAAEAQPPTIPENLQLYQAGFTRVIIRWSASSDDIAVEGYRVLRDGVQTGITSQTEYADQNLIPDTSYVYTVKAYDGAGEESLPSSFITVKTLKNLDFDDAAVIQQVVDMVSVTELIPSSLISAVQNAFLSLNYADVFFTVLNSSIIESFVSREITLINEGEAPASEAERIADQEALDQVMAAYFPGHSFIELYLQTKTVEVGESHWQSASPEAAENLYEYSLNFLYDNESAVFPALNRLGFFRIAALNENSPRQDLIAGLHEYKNQLMRFFTLFPDSQSYFAVQSYILPAQNYFRYFPVLLSYDNYEQSVFDNALDMAARAKLLQNDDLMRWRYDRISAWELNNVKISIKNAAGNYMSGNFDLLNTSGNDLFFPSPPPPDQRTFAASGGELLIPVYKGHSYKLNFLVDVQGGPALKYSVPSFPHAKGWRTTYSQNANPVSESLADPNAPAEIILISGQPTSPYNLSAMKNSDTFTLSWDWAAPSGFALKDFKVFRGGVEIGTVISQSLSNIPLESADHTYTYTVIAYDLYGQPSDESLPIEVLPDNLSNEQLDYYAWKQLYFGSNPMFDYEDPDNDGLTNLQEYQLGSNPTIAPAADVKSTLQNISPGVIVSYYTGSWTSLPNFASLTPLSAGSLASGPNFASTSGAILTSGLADYAYLSCTAYFDAPAEGYYRFYLNSDDGSKLYIDNSLLIANDGIHSSREYSSDIYLKAGVHSLRLEYFEYNNSACLQLEWAGPGFVRTPLNGSNLWNSSDVSALLAESIAWNKDSDRDHLADHEEIIAGTNRYSADTDNDGLSDYEELRIYATNPLSADGDSDGLSDYDEIFLTFSDPNAADANNTVTDVLVVNGSAGISIIGDWQNYGNSIYASSRNGTIEYALDVFLPGVYRLEIEGTQHNSLSSISSFLLELFIADSSCGSQTLTASYGVNGKVYFYLPKLQPGIHSAKIKWTNVASNVFLRINALRLQSLGGPDADNNGIPDWVDARNEALTLVTVPASSKTSPLCIEGANASNIEQISIAGFYTAPGEEPVPPIALHSIENGWYADAALTPNAPSNLTISFQNGQFFVNKTTTWLPSNIITDNDTAIRLNDSLLLTASPEGAGQGTVSFTVEGQVLTTVSDAPLPYKFENTGDIQIAATFTPDDGSPATTGSLNVKVVSSYFNGNPVCFFNEARIWDNPALDDLAVVLHDTNVNIFESDLNPGRRLDIRAVQNAPGYVIARLGQDGPIMANANIKIVIAEATYSSLSAVTTFTDGSVMVQSQISLSVVPPDLRIYLKIFVAGITFDDGTIERWVTAADFDEYGVYKYNMLRSAGAYTGNCHSISLYQGDALVKSY